MHRQAIAVVAIALSSTTLGCTGFGRAIFGHSYSVTGRENQSGPVFGVDALLAPKPKTFFNPGVKPLPLGVHNSLEVALAPDRKTVGWGTALGAWGKPNPVAPYFLGGTYLHFDYVNDHFSFGNASPYIELGMLTPFGNRDEDETSGPIFTLGLELSYLIQYLDETKFPGFFVLKFGLGWDAE